MRQRRRRPALCPLQIRCLAPVQTYSGPLGRLWACFPVRLVLHQVMVQLCSCEYVSRVPPMSPVTSRLPSKCTSLVLVCRRQRADGSTARSSGGMYMAEVLEAVCQRRKLSNPKDYALVVEVSSDVKINIPLDRTVRSLQGKRELILIKKNMLREYGVEVRERKGTTDPNGTSSSKIHHCP